MAKNFVQDGKNINYTNLDAVEIESGAVVELGSIIGIAQGVIAPGKTGVLSIEGVWALPKASAATFTVGALAYWKTADKTVVAAPGTGIIPVGVALSAAGAGKTSVNVKINGQISVAVTVSGS
jgi:predicted RecA/RadA family phage recombinase